MLDSAQAFFSDVRMARDAQDALASVQFRMRYPASFLHLGEAPVPSV